MMAELSATVDVRDMVCAQALALVAQRMSRLGAGGTLTVVYNADDVRRDVTAWARECGCAVTDAGTGQLQLGPGRHS